jgi:hypothetical protein
MRKIVVALFGVLVTAGPVAAQTDKPVDINVGFGWTFPSTEGLKGDFNAGWHGTIGATFNLSPKIGILADYTYARMNGPSKTILVGSTPGGIATSSQLVESNHQMHIGTFDLVYKAMPHDSAIGGYVLGGLGIYHRIIQLTSPAIGYTTICDPYWLVCYPTAVSVDNILGDRSSNDFGINFGGGLTFGHEAKFYVESRYHYVWGPTINAATNLPAGVSNPCSGGCSTNAAYFPLTFGVRW